MENMNLLQQCNNKYLLKNTIPEYVYDLSLNEFIMYCYLHCDPSSYGKFIMGRLLMEVKKSVKSVSGVSDKIDRGDFSLSYPYNDFVEMDVNGEQVNYLLNSPYKKFESFYEGKVSFLGKNGNYQIRNIRPYQNINGGFLICLVDCENNFNVEYYVINSQMLRDTFSLSHMNGSKKHHEDSSFNNMGTGFFKGSKQHLQMRALSKLNGTSFNSLVNYLIKTNNKLKSNFNQTEEYKTFYNKNLYFKDYFTISDRVLKCKDYEIMSSNSDIILKEFLNRHNKKYYGLAGVSVYLAKSENVVTGIKIKAEFYNMPSVHKSFEKVFDNFFEDMGKFYSELTEDMINSFSNDTPHL